MKYLKIIINIAVGIVVGWFMSKCYYLNDSTDKSIFNGNIIEL